MAALLFTVALQAWGGAIGSGQLLGAPAPSASSATSRPAVRVPASLSPPASLLLPSVVPTPTATLDIEGTALKDLLPDQLRGVSLLKVSVEGDAFAADASTTALLDRLDASAEDASAAFAVDPGGRLSGQVVALRVAGADSVSLRDEYRAAVEAIAGTELQQETIGGKLVLTGQNPEDPTSAVYFYARGDVLLFVFTADRSLAAEALALLP